eukprot:gene4534-6748_t
MYNIYLSGSRGRGTSINSRNGIRSTIHLYQQPKHLTNLSLQAFTYCYPALYYSCDTTARIAWHYCRPRPHLERWQEQLGLMLVQAAGAAVAPRGTAMRCTDTPSQRQGECLFMTPTAFDDPPLTVLDDSGVVLSWHHARSRYGVVSACVVERYYFVPDALETRV